MLRTLLLLALVAPVQPSANPPPRPAPPSPAVAQGPRSNLSGLIREDDYPAAAIANEEQGSVAVRVSVDTRGRVAGCEVETSSGSAALDSKTCEIVKARARFAPARDSAGRPVAGEFRQRITWRLEDPIMPTDNWSYEMVVTYFPDGKTTSCKAEGGGAFKYPSTTTANCVEQRDLSAELRDAGIVRPGVTTIATTQRRFFRGLARGLTLPRPPRAELIVARQVVELSIAADGKVRSCTQVSFEGLGQSPPPPCAGFDQFAPPVGSTARSKPITATMVTSISVRVEKPKLGIPTG